MRMHKRFLVAIPIILIVLVVIPFLIPMGAYVSNAEQVAADILKVPVKVGGLRIALLPTPRLNITNLVIGSDDELTVEDVAVLPALTSLFSETKVISSLKVRRPIIKQSVLDIVSNLEGDGSANEDSGGIMIRMIVISDVQFIWEGINIPEFNINLTLSPDNRPDSALVTTTDGKVEIKLLPESGSRKIYLSAHDWTLPVGPPLYVGQLDGEMKWMEERLEVQHLDMELYGGVVNILATLDWQKNWMLDGKLNAADIEVEKPVAMMSSSTQLSGRLNSEGRFQSVSKEPGKLLEQLQADFRFKVMGGVLDGFDLAKAAALLGTRGGLEGQTRFDTLTGVLNVSGKQYHLRDLDIVSGLLKATGDVKVRPNKQLGGQVKVEIKKGATLAAIPLQVSGTTEKPLLLPTKAALAGAAAGTAVLGPGVGTSLGIQAVDKLKGLFGNKEE